MNWIFNYWEIIIEIIAVILGIIYVILATKNKISCWIYGILGSLLSVYLFVVYAQLYAEAVLYIFYVIAGVYGWFTWKNSADENGISVHSYFTHVKVIGIGLVLAILLYLFIDSVFPKAQKPLIDSFTTIFSFIATYLTAKKWLENWLYWIVIDFTDYRGNLEPHA